MDERNLNSEAAPESGMVPAGYPVLDSETEWQARERMFSENATRHLRPATWFLALVTVIPIFLMVASVAAIDLGLMPPGEMTGEPLFSSQPVEPDDAQPDIVP